MAWIDGATTKGKPCKCGHYWDRHTGDGCMAFDGEAYCECQMEPGMG